MVHIERESALTERGSFGGKRDPRDRRNGATLEEVASRAGVSRATVSRVVNGSPRVSPDDPARRRGRDRRARLRPQPRRPQPGHPPQRLDRRRHHRADRPTVQRPVLPAPPPRASARRSSARDLQLVLLMPASSGDAHRTADYLTAGPRRRRPAGQPPRRRPPPRADRGGRHPDGRRSAGRPRGAAGQLRRRRQPRRRAQRRRAPDRRRAADDRHDRRPAGHGGRASIASPGYRDALAEADLDAADPSLEAIGDFTQDGGAAAMEQLLAARPDIDAVFAASDLMAAGAIARPRRRRAPGARGRRGGRLRRLARRDDRCARSSPASANRSRRWARRWPACSSTSSRARIPCHGA